jgi:hypothetical protein
MDIKKRAKMASSQRTEREIEQKIGWGCSEGIGSFSHDTISQGYRTKNVTPRHSLTSFASSLSSFIHQSRLAVGIP